MPGAYQKNPIGLEREAKRQSLERMGYWGAGARERDWKTNKAEEKGLILPHSLASLMDIGTWWAMVHGGAKSQTQSQTKRLSRHERFSLRGDPVAKQYKMGESV